MSSNPYAKRSQMAPAARAVRAYAAPVNRLTGLFAAFDPASQGQFDLDSPPSPFIDLGWVENFRRSAGTKYEALRTGPGATSRCNIAPNRRRAWNSIFRPGASFS